MTVAFALPWLVLIVSSPSRSPIGVLFDLLVLSFVGAAIVHASWEGFSTLRAKIRGLVVVIGLVNLAAAEFAYAYWSVAQQNVNAFTEPLDRAGAAYLSMATFTTIEPGALAPTSAGARMVAAGQMGFGVVAFVVALASVLSARVRTRID